MQVLYRKPRQQQGGQKLKGSEILSFKDMLSWHLSRSKPRIATILVILIGARVGNGTSQSKTTQTLKLLMYCSLLMTLKRK